MKKFTKVFLVLMWLVALAGAGFGWWQLFHSDNMMLSMLKQAKLMQPNSKVTISNRKNETDFDASTSDALNTVATLEQSATVNPEDIVWQKTVSRKKK